MDHEKHMSEAIKLSIDSVLSGGGPFGAVIVKNGEIVGQGSNRVTVDNDPTAHGEIVAIRDACKNLNSFQLDGCTLYTSAEPCPMCLGAIYWARPEAVYFGNTKEDAANIDFDDSFIYEEIPKALGDRSIPFHELMRKEAGEAFTLWREKTDKTLY